MNNRIRKKIIFSGIVGFLLMLVVYGMWIEPYQVDVHHLQLEGTGVSKVLEGKIAVHLSDLHIAKIGRRERTILKIIDDLKPDLIFLTGDYVKWGCNYESALTFLSKLKAKVGVWAVMGDYDYSCSRKSCLFCHEPGSGMLTQQHKVKFLRNEMERISITNRYMWIGGNDSDATLDDSADEKVFSLGEKTPAIILNHSPLLFDLVDRNQEVLILAGDTHGGQIRLPRWLWNILGYEKNARYNHGFFQDGRKRMYVSRGIGTSHFPMRILSRPELVVVHF